MPRSGPHRYGAYERAHKDDTAERMRARRMMIRKVGAAAVRGKDVDHIRSIKGGGKTTMGNLRIRDPGENRGDKTY